MITVTFPSNRLNAKSDTFVVVLGLLVGTFAYYDEFHPGGYWDFDGIHG